MMCGQPSVGGGLVKEHGCREAREVEADRSGPAVGLCSESRREKEGLAQIGGGGKWLPSHEGGTE